jgi:hypothetical protein
MKSCEEGAVFVCKGCKNHAPLAGPALTGTAGASPASSNTFTQVSVESSTLTRVAFNEGGRGARGPSKERARSDGYGFYY